MKHNFSLYLQVTPLFSLLTINCAIILPFLHVSGSQIDCGGIQFANSEFNGEKGFFGIECHESMDNHKHKEYPNVRNQGGDSCCCALSNRKELIQLLECPVEDDTTHSFNKHVLTDNRYRIKIASFYPSKL